jgi:RNA ligase (TIGR02306 family)
MGAETLGTETLGTETPSAGASAIMTSLVTRRLVSVRKIASVTSIPNASAYVSVKIGGWNVVARRSDEYEEGQLVVYVEIDSIIPNHGPFWEYYNANKQTINGKTICLVKTCLVHKQLSQGLIYKIDRLREIKYEFDQLKLKYPPEEAERILMTKAFEGRLGVQKYEPAELKRNSSHHLGSSPVFIEQPGCIRAQNMYNLFGIHGQNEFIVMEKLDGVPMSVYMVQPDSKWWTALPVLKGAASIYADMSTRIGVCGRSQDNAESDDSRFWKTAKSQGIIDDMKRRFLGKNIAVQGELCGSSIMHNTMGFPVGEHRFYVFDIYDIDKQKYFPPLFTRNICREMGWDHAPIINDGIYLNQFANGLDDLLKKAEGTGVLGKMREGLVFKSRYGRTVFKAISNPWLLATGKKV